MREQSKNTGLYTYISIVAPTDNEIGELSKRFDLPEDIFKVDSHSEDVSRIETLDSQKLGACLSLVLFNIEVDKNPYGSLEKALYPVSFVLSDELLLIISSKNIEEEQLNKQLKNIAEQEQQSMSEVVIQTLLFIYQNYLEELTFQKNGIDEVSQATRSSTKKEYLLKLTDLERNLVYLEQTLDDQKNTLDELWEQPRIECEVNELLKYDVQVICRKVNKQIHLYRELIESTSSLISSLMDNSLNRLMKYLESAALIISVPTMIFGLWGINTGGLIGTESTIGSIGVVVFAIAATIAAFIYLRKKDFTE